MTVRVFLDRHHHNLNGTHISDRGRIVRRDGNDWRVMTAYVNSTGFWVNTELHKWFIEQMGEMYPGRVCLIWDRTYGAEYGDWYLQFNDASDALMFKLTWGGQ